MDLFLFERKGRDTDSLIRLSLDRYGLKGISDARIERSGSGKPYLAGDFGVHFSVSHTGRYWACVIADHEAGLDIQTEKDIDTGRLAGRFFTEEEKAYVSANGSSGFFDVWVRKEALAKCLGTSLMSIISKVSVVSDGELSEEICTGGKSLRMKSADTGRGMKCAVCVECSVEEADESIRIVDVTDENISA